TGRREGGSTITQQLARNLFPNEIGNAGTINRKLREIIAAIKIERIHTKRDILEAYLNTVPFLFTATGIERAAQTYFSKPSAELTVGEAATLIAMLKGPNQYNPVRNPARAIQRRNLVLRLMVEHGSLDEHEAQQWIASDLGLRFRRLPGLESLAPHFTAAVRVRMEAWAERNGYDLEHDGLVIHTTLDLNLQRLAEEAVRTQTERLQAVADVEWSRRRMPGYSSVDAYVRARSSVVPFGYFWQTHERVVDRHLRRTSAFASEIDRGVSEDDALASLRSDEALMDSVRQIATRLEAGLVAIEPSSGDVKVWVGSRDFSIDEYDHVAVARRQPGSTFKPFLYAAALRRGYSPLDRVLDRSIEVDLGGGRTWTATNSGSYGSGAAVTLADALAYSKNTVSVRLMHEIGPSRVAFMARELGISDSELDLVPSLALGTSPVTLLEMVSAYGTIANDGLRRVPRLVTRVETASGVVLDTFSSQGGQVMTRRDARTLIDMLRGVVERGTGRGIRNWDIEGDVAGKTGTTQGNADGWFVLMHPRLVTGAWVGFNDQQISFRSNYWGQGAHNALFAVADFFNDAQAMLPNVRFADPPRYRMPIDSTYARADSVIASLDDYFNREYYDFDSLRALSAEDFEHTEFDQRAYERVFGEVEDQPDEDPFERLRNTTLAEDEEPFEVNEEAEVDTARSRDGG
ncbi:MAG: transglycosylase domain-containing protein, partial [Rubricoccaceae bacterium]|nr:transglycosylase domain-containing protein [Rubricoccaceae bacterium]